MPETDPVELARWVNDRPRPWLIGVDVDGTLSPIAPRPDEARLADGAREALEDLAARVGVMVAIVSGRALAELHGQFGIPDTLIINGSHGAEVGTEVDHPTPEEQTLLESARKTMQEAVDELPGAWIEHKPLGLAFHVRQADPQQAEAAIAQLEATLRSTAGLTVHHGRKVLEATVRPMTKAAAFDQLRRRLEPITSVFIGDDANDELVFQSLDGDDVAIKVGPGPTSAPNVLASPDEVVRFLRTLADSE